VTAVVFSPDGRRALSASQDGTLRLWDLRSGNCLRTLTGHTGKVTAAAFAADGRWGFSASADATIGIWDLATGACVRALEGHTKPVRSISLTPDSRWLLSGSADETLCLWELDWEYDIPEPADFDDGARPYLTTFLVRHCPPAADGIRLAGKPSWGDADVPALLEELQRRGYGWLRHEGVRRELQKMTAAWQGPPPLA
jgi:WD40 repeat protein